MIDEDGNCYKVTQSISAPFTPGDNTSQGSSLGSFGVVYFWQTQWVRNC